MYAMCYGYLCYTICYFILRFSNGQSPVLACEEYSLESPAGDVPWGADLSYTPTSIAKV
jgi:hypothetical protein